jgi:hypothetical protein
MGCADAILVFFGLLFDITNLLGNLLEGVLVVGILNLQLYMQLENSCYAAVVPTRIASNLVASSQRAAIVPFRSSLRFGVSLVMMVVLEKI